MKIGQHQLSGNKQSVLSTIAALEREKPSVGLYTNTEGALQRGRAVLNAGTRTGVARRAVVLITDGDPTICASDSSCTAGDCIFFFICHFLFSHDFRFFLKKKNKTIPALIRITSIAHCRTRWPQIKLNLFETTIQSCLPLPFLEGTFLGFLKLCFCE